MVYDLITLLILVLNFDFLLMQILLIAQERIVKDLAYNNY